MNQEQILLNRIAELEVQLARETEEKTYFKTQYQSVLEQFRLAQQKQFGTSAEGFDAQGDLFNEAEEIVLDVENEQQEISYTRKKPTRKPLPKDLPREQIVHDIPESEKQCGCCGGELHKMGESVSEKLEFIPASIKVIEHIRPKYACRECEKSGTENTIKQAKMPPSPIEKGIATPSLLAQIITSKYQYALPLYRQESLFKQHGIELSRQTMSDWMIKSAHLFEPLYDRLKAELLKQPAIHADETPLKVLESDKKKSYMWVYCSGTDAPKENCFLKNIVLYDYQNSRAGACPDAYLQGYAGYLQVDGYQGYAQTKATLAGCWAHARRKFMDIKKIQGKKKTGKVDVILSLIQKLYGIESKIKDKTPEEKYAARQKDAKKIIDKINAWLEKTQPTTLQKTKLGDAVTYLANQWDKLIVYLDDGHLNIDNNRAERAIKPFVIGRKNWLFSNTAKGADASAMLYSIIETAKSNNLIPFDYIKACLQELCQPKPNIDTLLPWNFKG